jgi:ADP-heptose:LPS heptosyltransferase
MMKYIVISPWSKQLRNGKYNAKNYPYWKEVIDALKVEYSIVQIGVDGEEQLVDDFRKNMSLKEIKELVLDDRCETWIAVDNFLQHLLFPTGKKGIVLWGQSDPNIFGYKTNRNLLKSRSYLRKYQFQVWDEVPHDKEVFVPAEYVIKEVRG